ncbi:MAG: hypothetical protein SOU19_01350 [Candidatus Caccosoma sp.]|nr:hypothetical protein [Candidatus Caccosoma sp.]
MEKKFLKILMVLLMLASTGCTKKEEDNFLNSINQQSFRISAINDEFYNNEKEIAYKMYAPYDDTYYFESLEISEIHIYNSKKELLVSGKNSAKVSLRKNEEIIVKVKLYETNILNLEAYSLNHLVELPYSINNNIDMEVKRTEAKEEISYDPLKASDTFYTKRSDDRGLYVNCNNPEKITLPYLNKCLTAQEVTNKEVFFTFEHNNTNTNYYYGYRVTNVSDEDIYITVKNLGYQVNGKGSWLGEDEWVKFYNTNFRVQCLDGLSGSQLNNYNSFVSFANDYESLNRQPITYRIPKNKYIYVMGGTTLDSYRNINVFDSADIIVNSKISGCSNGAVIFEVKGGKAIGQFFAYTMAKIINNTDYVNDYKEAGYVGDETYGSQYVGYDNCYGVVDSSLEWEFNDYTKSQYLGVNFDNNAYNNGNKKGDRYSSISPLSTINNKDCKKWVTHINPNHTANAYGTDMTKYITIDSETKEPITIDYYHYDGKGNEANIGNWMVDYIDTITLVNKGNNEREFTYNMYHNGVILAFIRDENGFIDESFKPKYCISLGGSKYGSEIRDYFSYTVKVKPHSAIQFSINYNLLANSNGNISHSAYLK